MRSPASAATERGANRNSDKQSQAKNTKNQKPAQAPRRHSFGITHGRAPTIDPAGPTPTSEITHQRPWQEVANEQPEALGAGNPRKADLQNEWALQAKASLLSSPIMQRPALPVIPDRQDCQPETVNPLRPETINLPNVIDFAVRMGRARQRRELYALAAASWSAVIEGKIGNAEYEALQVAKGRRHAEIEHRGEMHRLSYGAPRRPVYDRTAAKDRRRGLVRVGLVPDWLANGLTLGEESVATVILQDIQTIGRCDKTNGEIAQLAGCCERLVIRTKKRLGELRCDFEIIKRVRHGTRHDTTIIKAASDRLKVWLRDKRAARRPSEGRGVGEQPVSDLQVRDIRKNFHTVDRPQRGNQWQERARSRPPDTLARRAS